MQRGTPFALAGFEQDPTYKNKQGDPLIDKPNYKEFVSNAEKEYLQIKWIPDIIAGTTDQKKLDSKNREEGHFEVTPMKGKILIGLDISTGEVTHLVPATGVPQTPIGNTLIGNNPNTYGSGKGSTLPVKGKGKGKGPGKGPGKGKGTGKGKGP